MSDLLTAHIVQRWPYFALSPATPLLLVRAGSSQGWVISLLPQSPAPMIRPLIICPSNYLNWGKTCPLLWATLLTVMTVCMRGSLCAAGTLKTVKVEIDFCRNLLINLYPEFKHKSSYVNPAELFQFPLVALQKMQQFNTGSVWK